LFPAFDRVINMPEIHVYYNAHLKYFYFKFFTNLYLLIRVFSKTTSMKKSALFFLTILIAMTSLAQKVKTSAVNAAQGLSKEEKQVMAWIDAHMPQAIEMLKESVNINSGTLNIEGVKKVGALFAKEFEKAGFTTEWVAMPDSIKRAGHLVASRRATASSNSSSSKKGKRLFLIGHLDTVFEPDMPANPFTMLNDSTATGQGVNDMKGGDVVVIMALQALEQAGLLKNTDITAYFTGDEEHAGYPREVTRGDFINRAKQADIALAFEGANGLNSVATGRRGASGWRLDVTGKTGHSSGVFTPSAGYGAIYEAARILNQFRETLSTEKYLTFNPGIIIGGSDIEYNSETSKGAAIAKTNIISPAVTVTGDLRFLTEDQKDRARFKMKEIVAQNLAQTSAKISFVDGIPSMAPTEGNNQVLSVINSISIDIGAGATVAGDPGSRGAGDISYVAAYVDCIDGLGASGRGAHAPGETIHLNQLPFLIKRAALTIYRLSR
jgi:glutamate carboxypeptidase